MSADRSETVERVVDPIAVAGLAELLGAADVDLRAGAPLPALWHWVALSRWAAPELLGPDGHPRLGTGILPKVTLPRRMFGGGTLRLHAPIPVGDKVTVTSEASEPQQREGRSGPLILVDLTVRVHDATGEPLLTEIQNIVYTSARTEPAIVEPTPQSLAHSLIGTARTDNTEIRRDFDTDPARLARFSALTANSHRIHLDWPYATRVEGYPGLVVHGPLMAVAAAEAARRDGAQPPHAVRHRGLAPLFCGQAAQLISRPGPHRVVEVVSPAATPRVHARLELDPEYDSGEP